jgi:hydroxyacylglutathione hydrolase
MIIRNFYDGKLAQGSYLIGCSATGEAIVIDPSRHIHQYIQTANENGLKIVAATETHIHADYLSGTRELAAATGATMYLSGEGGVDWQYAYAIEPTVALLNDGDTIQIGNVSLKAIHTPGHTPEHLAFLLTDHPVSQIPHSLFTGDFVFVGDVGRPDLLEKVVQVQGAMDQGARQLFRSLKKLQDLPDSLLLWPGHGAGSACGKSLGGSPVTTLGYERATNWALLATDEDRFVNEILSGQPEPPNYFKEMKRMNRQGPALLNPPHNTARTKQPTGQLIDIREDTQIRAAAYQEAIAIPYCKSFTGWAGWMLDYEAPITFLADTQEAADKATQDLIAIGLDNVAGWIHPQDLDQSKFSPIPAVALNQITPDDLVLDVRGTNEWLMGHLANATHIPFGHLQQRLQELPKDKKIVVHCASGGRSPIACTTLRKAGFTNIVELPGGMNAIETEAPTLVCRT